VWNELRDWDQLNADREGGPFATLVREGLLCIGDAAHAMSRLARGINLAIQDAVAAANILVDPLRAGTVTVDTLQKVQRRRTFPTRMTQRLQIMVQKNVISTTLANRGPLQLNWLLKLI